MPLPSAEGLPLGPRSAALSLPNSALLSPTEHHPLSPSADATNYSSGSPSTTSTVTSSLDKPSYFLLPPATSPSASSIPSSTLEPTDARNVESGDSLAESSTSAATDATGRSLLHRYQRYLCLPKGHVPSINRPSNLFCHFRDPRINYHWKI
jgi:hypothetical protein